MVHQLQASVMATCSTCLAAVFMQIGPVLELDGRLVPDRMEHRLLVTDHGAVAPAERKLRSPLCCIVALNLAIDRIHVRLDEDVTALVRLQATAIGREILMVLVRLDDRAAIEDGKERVAAVGRELELLLVRNKSHPRSLDVEFVVDHVDVLLRTPGRTIEQRLIVEVIMTLQDGLDRI